ncbi:putative GCN5-related N-acetyltransferase [Actinoplanes missouriensis 431]|uniref:Putative GCN5-related N-acetyltransferase n=1 Tax=Actinoplanes missouriensis (strain ATCC 14538 / DSM 43046 / CBS 188.64 / JCM 3121 / NBRC 102363 / NCIMB 12654 / NRRL B-3342 / UNCC 431) TaxID=512565 RepID=I0GZZ6_ACTM4|nr:GNAT family N-acetyltransferase [Actinoplanes missouriensis]BAL86333.1 putative GCN5-related N-acetyltransferase [Actinoplanes missouriensis 431]
MDEELSVRPATTDDFAAICELLGTVFHEDVFPELEAEIYETERSLVADDGGTVVGHADAFTRDLTVPGAVVPAAHVSGVGVLPTHRRRGILTRLMQRQLREIAEAGREPIAVLWASETKIYPRFGYGPACSRLTMSIMNREVRLPAPPAAPSGRLRMAEPKELLAVITKLYEQLRPAKVGWSSRDDRWWRHVLSDLKEKRDGATPLRAVVHEGPGGPTGYALWRVKDDWNAYGPNGDVQVREVVAEDPETYQALWRFLLGVDLSRTVTYRLGALDEPLQYLVDEPRRLGASVGDGLWIRLVDLPAALAARRYAADVDVVIEVADPLLEQNTGRWRLVGGPTGAICSRTTDPADLSCTVTDLGAAYLGATSLASLTAAGRVRQLTGNDPSIAFGWHRKPSPTEIF